MDVAVMGCVVNGPGEARVAQVGIAGGSPNLLYINGQPDHKVSKEQLVDELERVIREQLRLRAEQGDASSAPRKTIPLKQIG
jgi:(E)-4-hydroxy-3-methylbut-2-enyl-diphosphate synthase